MSKRVRKRIPINLIAGPLGVGKTTTINHLLDQRPEGERWAILVNEYGLVGLDAALMEGADTSQERAAVEIREVAGGCICCSAGFLFEASLVLLLQRRPDRLLIEPTGLAALSGIMDTLNRKEIREAVDVRSVLCLLDPSQLDEALLREEVRDQVDAADILLANRSDLADPSQLEAFQSWADRCFPPKRLVGAIKNGQVPLAWLDLVCGRELCEVTDGHRHGTDHEHAHESDAHARGQAGSDEQNKREEICDAKRPIVQRSHLSSVASTFGWVCWSGLVFDAKLVSAWLREISQLPGARRAKAVVRTDQGWEAFNFAEGVEERKPSGYRRDSRLELIIEGEGIPQAEALEQKLRACVRSPVVDG